MPPLEAQLSGSPRPLTSSVKRIRRSANPISRKCCSPAAAKSGRTGSWQSRLSYLSGDRRRRRRKPQVYRRDGNHGVAMPSGRKIFPVGVIVAAQVAFDDCCAMAPNRHLETSLTLQVSRSPPTAPEERRNPGSWGCSTGLDRWSHARRRTRSHDRLGHASRCRRRGR